MTVYPLRTLADVIYFQLYRSNLPGTATPGRLDSVELWQVALAAGSLVEPPLPTNSKRPDSSLYEMRADARVIRNAILGAVEHLEGLGVISAHYNEFMGGKYLGGVELTHFGAREAAGYVWSNQAVAGHYEHRKSKPTHEPRSEASPPPIGRRGAQDFPTTY